MRAQEVTIKTKEAQLQECYREIASLKEERQRDEASNQELFEQYKNSLQFIHEQVAGLAAKVENCE